MKTIITYGTFDLYHVGHARLIERLSKLGDKLVIGCSTDSFNELKGKKTVMPYEHRREVLLSNKYVHSVFPEESWDQKIDDILREKADIFAMGDDWAGKFDYLSEYTSVVYLPRTQDISTTEIKIAIKEFNKEKIFEIKNQIKNLSRSIESLA